MDSGIAALLGALIGSLATWLSAWSIEHRRDSRQARRAAIAAASEIAAAMGLLRARKWREGVQAFEDSARAGSVQQFSVHVADQYLPLTREALRECGAMDTQLTVLFARLVMLESSLLSDLKRLAQFPVDHPLGLLSASDPEGSAEIYNQLGQIIDSAMEAAANSVARVNQIYPEKKPTLLGRIEAAWAAFFGRE